MEDDIGLEQGVGSAPDGEDPCILEGNIVQMDRKSGKEVDQGLLKKSSVGDLGSLLLK